MFRHQIYQHLGRHKSDFLKRVETVADKIGMRAEWRNVVGLTGSSSARPSYLRQDVIDNIVSGAKSPTNLVHYIDQIRELVKQAYGDDYDACPVNSCEAALWLSLEVLSAPPVAGRGDSYRARYIGLYEAHSEHQLSYGRPFPPKYKDVFADRSNISGELGILGRRLHNLDVIIVSIEGARYEEHGIKSFIVPLLTTADAARTKDRLRTVVDRHGSQITSLISLGYDTVGYGYGEKKDGVTSDLKKVLGNFARELDVPYIVDNARGIPFMGASLRDINADLMMYSMDKVAGSPISGLIVGRSECVIPLQRAVGWHSERFGGGVTAYGKGAFSSMDPGREALIGQVAALSWIQKNRKVIEMTIDDLCEIVIAEAAPLVERYGSGIHITPSYNGGAVELNYVDTWLNGKPGLPIFSTEDKAAAMNLVVAGLGVFGILPPSCDEGNVVITPGRGLVGDDGRLIADRARVTVRGLISVLSILGDMVSELAGRSN